MRSEVTALFLEVADRSVAEREDYYVRQQVPDALRAEVESLLKYDMGRDSLRGYVESAERLLLDASSSGQQEPARSGRGAPDAIGRFAVTRLLGRGGMGEVYLARDPLIDRLVAIKLIGGGLEGDTQRRWLVREARAAGRLHHPNIVTVFEVGEHEGRSFIAMEYVSGETAGSIIRRRAALSLRRRLEMIEGACAGLAHAHREGVIHLDIKPDNLMLDDGGVVKVLDFGISRVLQSETLATVRGAGTLRYMSPEQIQGRPLDHRSDVFSLGCSLFEVVSYTPAFSGSTKEIVTRIAAGPAPSLLDLSPGIDRRLDDIVGRAMALEPSERYGDLEELRTKLAEVRAGIDPAEDEPDPSSLLGVASAQAAEGTAVASGSRRSSRRRRAWRSRSTIAVGSGAAALAGIAALFAWGVRGGPERAGAPPEVPVAAATSSEPEPTPAVDRPQPAAPDDEVWRRLARGDRAGVLDRLGAGGSAPADAALASAVVDTVRTTALRTREAAVQAGSNPSTATYRAGEAQLARANRLAAGGQTVESLRAFWQAADLFARTSAAPAAPDNGPSVAQSTTPGDLATVSSGAREPAPPIVEQPQPPPAAPIPITPTAAVRDPAPNPAPLQEAPSDSRAILDTLRRYDAAYQSLDVAALLKVFPSLGNAQVEQLRRTFAGMTAYEMDTRINAVNVTGDSASVLARVARRMSPRVGGPVVNEVDTEFRLQRAGGDWVIVGVTAR